MAQLEPRSGGIVFCKVNNMILVAMVRYNKPDIWDIPRGHIEKGESPKKTAVRELYEETGIASRLPYRVGTFEHNAKTRSVLLHYDVTYYADVVKCKKLKTKDEKEVKETRWIPIQDAIRLLLDRPQLISFIYRSLVYFMKKKMI